MLAYERAHEGEVVLVVINASIDDSEASFPTGFTEGERLVDALGRASAPFVTGAGGALTIRLPGRASVVLTR